MFSIRNFKKIDEFLTCGINLGRMEPYQNLETNFIEFTMIDLLRIPNFKKVEELQTFYIRLDLMVPMYQKFTNLFLFILFSMVGLLRIPNFKAFDEYLILGLIRV